MSMDQIEYKDIGLSNDFFFTKVMEEYPHICKKLAEISLNRKIEDIFYVEREKTLKEMFESKGIRLDVYFEDEKNKLYNMEMQTEFYSDILKRLRYYQGEKDIHQLNSGDRYIDLRDSYTLVYCTFDFFNKGEYVYINDGCYRTLSNEKLISEGAIKYIFNAKGTRGKIDIELKNFLEYLKTNKPNDDFTQETTHALNIVKNKWEDQYMTYQMKMNEYGWTKYDEGKEEGASEKQEKIVSKMIEKGLSFNEVKEFVPDLTEEEYSNIKNK